MNIVKYEIDMLDVKNADAFLIHFFTDNNWEYIVLVDGGNYSDGETIVQFIREHYAQQYIDLAICTHCDKDHFGGIMYLLEQMKDNVREHICIKKIWIHDPARHVDAGSITWITDNEKRAVKARSVYDINDSNLWDILDYLISSGKIQWAEPFSNSQETNWNGVISVVGPTVEYYSSLVHDFRNDLLRKKKGSDEIEPDTIDITEADETLNKRIDGAYDDSSPHNMSSVIFLFKPNEATTYLFTGDACRDSFNKLLNEDMYASLANVTWLKVPHHGSIHNLDSTLITHFSPEIAYVSTKEYDNYLSRSILNAFKKVGTRVYSTSQNGHIWYHRGTDNRNDYSPIDPL